MTVNLERAVVLLPSHSLEDFPLHHLGADADGLLAAWATLWHPRLLAASRRLPGWYRADCPPDQVAGQLFFIPAVSDHLVLAGWPSRTQHEGGVVVRRHASPQALLEETMPQLANLSTAPLDPAIEADFLALGYCYLMLEILTRQMRYVGSLDELHIERRAVAAADAALAGDATTARTALGHCFESLLESRHRFYPAEAYLIDLTLLAESTLGPQLALELSAAHPQNLLLSAELAGYLADREPQLAHQLGAAIGTRRVCLVGGALEEAAPPPVDLDSLVDRTQRALATYSAALGHRPAVFGQRTGALSPVWPQVLARSGFHGALHLACDGSRTPQAGQSKFRWEGLDGSSIEAVGRPPRDAAESGTLLALPQHLAESMDLDYVAMVLLAHWPSRVCTWFDLLRRATSYAPVLGKFITLDEFFEHTMSPGRISKFPADDYQPAFVAETSPGARSQPASRHAYRAVDTWASLLGGQPRAATLPDGASLAAQGTARLAAALAAPAPRPGDARGFLVCNPLAVDRVAVVALPGAIDPLPAGLPVRAAQVDHDAGATVTRVAVEVPGCGFAWVGPGPAAAAPARSWWRGAAAADSIASDLTLRNDLIDVTIDPETGGIRTVRDRRIRGNLLSARVGLRLADPAPAPGTPWQSPDANPRYARQVARSIRVVTSGTAVGQIEAAFDLLDDQGRHLAHGTQKLALAAGSRVVRLELELQPHPNGEGNPGTSPPEVISYAAWRWAWSDEAAQLLRGVAGCLQASDARRLSAAELVEIQSTVARVAILAPYGSEHRRTGSRLLDSEIPLSGQWSGAVAVNVSSAAVAWQTWQLGEGPLGDEPWFAPSVRPSTTTGWLFHLDSKQVLATAWEPWSEGDNVVGFRVRLLETAGRAAAVRLRVFRALRAARHVDFLGDTLTSLRIDDDAVLVNLGGFELAQIECRW